MMHNTKDTNTMPRRTPIQALLTATERDMLELRAQSEGLTMSAMVGRMITQDWFNTHAHIGPEAYRRMLEEIQETARRRVKTANGRWRKSA
ncbi:hypothetical protein WV31_02835 [Magnetospirillum sp. ME-1]|uniref:hypothetical protein n=1 Tax=Magnetospirillum sp. ME-1 TaxID=1639348 RepID=UPI000A17D4D4|nr:hypothetical protein [Magnetospirillum sp. ME-1]ARJ64680.1 hypothetical protein WV31_02835 [Magnetospirillum sp. ME-1]